MIISFKLNPIFKQCRKVYSRSECCNCCIINVREYRRGNQKLTIQRNWQHGVHKTKKNKIKTQHNMCWTILLANKHNLMK